MGQWQLLSQWDSGAQWHHDQAMDHLADNDEVLAETSTLGNQVAAALDCYGSKGDHKDWHRKDSECPGLGTERK